MLSLAVMGIAALLPAQQSITIISPSKSAIELGTDPSLQFFTVYPTKTKEKSDAKTYLLNTGSFSKQELKSVEFSLLNTKVLMAVRKDSNGHWNAWLPSGAPILGKDIVVPPVVQNRAKPDEIYLVVQQDNVRKLRNKVIDDLGVTSFPGTISLSLNSETFTTWIIAKDPFTPYMDIPFKVETQDLSVASLPIKQGEVVEVDGVQFSVAAVEAGPRETAVSVQQLGTAFPRSYQVRAVLDTTPPGDGRTISSWTSRQSSSIRMDVPPDLLRVGSNAGLSRWKSVAVDRKTTFYGYFGHIATKPTSE